MKEINSCYELELRFPYFSGNAHKNKFYMQFLFKIIIKIIW